MQFIMQLLVLLVCSVESNLDWPYQCDLTSTDVCSCVKGQMCQAPVVCCQCNKDWVEDSGACMAWHRCTWAHRPVIVWATHPHHIHLGWGAAAKYPCVVVNQRASWDTSTTGINWFTYWTTLVARGCPENTYAVFNTTAWWITWQLK